MFNRIFKTNIPTPPALPSNTPVSAIGISPQDDNVCIVGISSGRVFATTFGAPLLAEVRPAASTPRFTGRAVLDPKNINSYVTLVGYGVPDGQHLERSVELYNDQGRRSLNHN